jgi:hypothetical protein
MFDVPLSPAWVSPLEGCGKWQVQLIYGHKINFYKLLDYMKILLIFLSTVNLCVPSEL